MVSQNGHREVTIKEAAEILGISPIAVRKRLTRGKMPGHKAEDGVWWAHLTDALVTAEKEHQAEKAPESEDGIAFVIKRLEDEVTYLRGELATERQSRIEELARKDQMIATFGYRIGELSQKLEALPSTTTFVPEPPKKSFWAKLFGSGD